MKTKTYLVVYDVDGDVYLAKADLTLIQVKAAEILSSVYHIIPFPLEKEKLPTMGADEVLALRSEFDDEFDSDEAEDEEWGDGKKKR